MVSLIPLMTKEEQLNKLLSLDRANEDSILAYYEHRLGAISKEPRLMLMPLDDHLAHRGDGVFETIKYSFGKLYNLDEHLERMRRSAEGIYLMPPCSWQEIRDIVLNVAAASKQEMGLMRILLGRGPGGFGISPGECKTSSLYVVAYKFYPSSEIWYKKGLYGFKTSIPAKQGYLARIKNANYLPNVLMMREAEEKNLDVPLCFSEEGFLAESAVANICLVNQNNVLEIPKFSNSLPGTTILRVLDLLNNSIKHEMCKISEGDIIKAKEVLMLGTGPDCVAIVNYEGHTIGTGEEGPVTNKIRGLIAEDIKNSGTPIPYQNYA